MPRPASLADKPGGTGACDRYLGSLFGGSDTIAVASGFEPDGFQGPNAFLSGEDRSMAGGPKPNQWGHLWGFSMHIYATPLTGTSQATIYVPQGFTKHTAPSGNDAVALFYYPTLATQTNVTLAVYHVADYAMTSERNAAGSLRIGKLGGSGGNDFDYFHSHFEVHRGWGLPSYEQRNQTRLFFHDVFCPIDGSVPTPAPAIPANWSCDTSYYDETGRPTAGQAYCDCDCGAPDPDCTSNVPVDGCGDGQVCSTSGTCVAK